MNFSRTKIFYFSRISVAVLLCALLGLSASAQSNLGRILGTVTDVSGASVPGATVTITDTERGTSRTLSSGDTGEFLAAGLLPGKYSVRVESKNFKTVERQNVLLEVGNDVVVDVALQPGEQVDTVTVTEEIPQIEKSNATLGGTLSNETVNELPLNGRNYQNLVVLVPGTIIQPGGGGWTMSTNGVRPEENGFLIDGLTDDHPLLGITIINGPGVAGDAATILPIDAIQEVNIMENPPAEFGWKPGAIVNVGLKSGTNNIHGTAYAFGRDGAWDARNFFNPAPDIKAPVQLEQFGATIGGAIKKNKLFYFLGFENESYTVGNPFNVSVPQILPQATPNPGRSLPDAIAALQASGVQPSALTLALTGCTITPTISCTGGLYPANATSGNTTPLDLNSDFVSHNGLAKVDYHISDHHSLNGTFFISRGLITAEDQIELGPQWLSRQFNNPQVFGVNWTWTPNSKWVNSARFGYINMNRGTQSVDGNIPATSYGINTGVTNPVLGGFPLVFVAGFNFLGGFAAWPLQFGPTSVMQFVDSASYSRGNHTFKFGGEVRHNIVNYSRFSRGKGLIVFTPSPGFSSLENFLAGVPRRANVAVGTPRLHLTTTQIAGFVQDDWRITPRLTANIGLRYEYSTPLKDSKNQLGNFDPSAGLVQVGSQISSPYKGDHRDFAPRLGLSWDVSGKGRTVVHAGYSIVYDTALPMFAFLGQGNTRNNETLGLSAIPTGANLFVNGQQIASPGTIAYSNVTVPGGPTSNLAFNWQNNGPNVPLFQGNVAQCGDGILGDPDPCNVLGVDRNLKSPFTSNWTLGVQHALTNNLTANISYVGNHGSRLLSIRDINQPTPVAGGSALPGPFSAKFPYLNNINFMSNGYRSNYNGLHATLTGREFHRLSFVASYTYSHSLDQGSYNINQFLPQDSTRPDQEYGSGDFDVRHRFTLSFTYNFPNVEAPAQLLKGWQINSIVTLQSGQPWLSQDTGNNISGTGENSDRWDFFGNRADFTSGPNAIPCFGFAGSSCNPVIPAACTNAALAVDGGTPGPTVDSLNALGCYMKGSAVMIPPAAGTFGTMGRNIFRDSGFRNLDLSVTKIWTFRERLSMQFRAEFFNVLNHPNFANPYGGSNGYGQGTFDDPSAPGIFGCGCATPDSAAANPVLGAGTNRAIQLGLKLIF